MTTIQNMTSLDARRYMTLPYGAAAQMTGSAWKVAADWWRAQPARLFDETAPWNLGLYMARRMTEVMIDAVTRPVAMTEEDRAYKVEAEIPGVAPKDVDIRVTQDTLKISAAANGASGESVLRRLSAEPFEREMPLPPNVDAEKTTAEVHDGKLVVTMPKQPRPRDHKVTVKPA